MTRVKGFTLLELIVAIVIAAILAAVAMPAFQTTTRSNAVRSTTNDLVSTINLARQQSMSMRTQVKISPANGGWSNGWSLAFTDSAAGEDADFIPRRNVSITSSAGSADLVFRPKGGLQGGGDIEFTITHNNSNSISSTICVSFFGKITYEGCS